MLTNKPNDKPDSFYASSRQVWRRWLQKNHQSKKKVWLIIYHKSSAKPSVYYDAAVEEALCFGWIDSKPNKRDEQSYYLSFSPRNAKSKWSKLNRERVDKLVKEKRMTPSGMAMVNLAKNSGTWLALEKIDNMELPEDLLAALQKNKKAMENFSAFPPSSKRIILHWVSEAKRPETRDNRIKETVKLAALNIRANDYRS